MVRQGERRRVKGGASILQAGVRGEVETWEGNLGANRKQRREADTRKNLLTVFRNLELYVFTGTEFIQVGSQAGRQAGPLLPAIAPPFKYSLKR